MKKIISLALAASMVAGMSVASFARTTDKFEEPYVDQNSELYVYDKNGKSVLEKKDEGEITTDMPVAVMVENPLSNSEMKRYKAYFEAGVGADFVESVELKYHKYANKTADANKGDAVYEITSKNELAYSDIYDLGEVSYSKEIVESLMKDWALEGEARDYSVRLYVNAHGNEKEEFAHQGYVKMEDTLNDRSYAPVLVTRKGDKLDYQLVDYSNIAPSKANILEHSIEETVKRATKKTYPDASKDKYDQDYAWFVVVNFKTEAEKMDEDVMGKVTIAKSSAVAKDNFEDRDYYKTLNFINVNYDNSHVHKIVKETAQELEDFEFELNGQQAMFVVDTTGVKKLETCFSTKMNETVWEKYSEPDYELFFYGWDAGKFNRTGDLYFYADDAEFTADWHVYEIVDAKTGELKEIPVIFDEDEGTIKIRTRVLKNYVVSEEDLLGGDNAPVEENTKPATPDKEIPNTGR